MFNLQEDMYEQLKDQKVQVRTLNKEKWYQQKKEIK
ncbi:hypothetical protein IC3_04719 [Bacillus cereus VD142]|nr:hypothetical protein IC3_04719 [Bacillus cereus VD142]